MKQELESQSQTSNVPNREQQAEERQRRRTEQDRRVARQRAALRWWVGTVALTLFPTLFTIFVAVLRGYPLTLELVLDDGELVLASFLIITSTLISSNTIKNETIVTDAVQYFLYFLSFTQLISFTVIKTNETNHPVTVAVVSFGALIISICFSWIWYILTNERGVR